MIILHCNCCVICKKNPQVSQTYLSGTWRGEEVYLDWLQATKFVHKDSFCSSPSWIVQHQKGWIRNMKHCSYFCKFKFIFFRASFCLMHMCADFIKWLYIYMIFLVQHLTFSSSHLPKLYILVTKSLSWSNKVPLKSDFSFNSSVELKTVVPRSVQPTKHKIDLFVLQIKPALPGTLQWPSSLWAQGTTWHAAYAGEEVRHSLNHLCVFSLSQYVHPFAHIY